MMREKTDHKVLLISAKEEKGIHELEEEIAVKMTRLQDNDRQIQILQCAINQMNADETEAPGGNQLELF